MAWRCTRTELGRVLESVGADRDDQGRFLLSWNQGRHGLGEARKRRGEDLMISEDVRFRIRGRWARLLPALRRATSDTLSSLWDDGEGDDLPPPAAEVEETSPPDAA